MSYRPLKTVARRLERMERPSARGRGRSAARRGAISGRLRYHYKWPEWGAQTSEEALINRGWAWHGGMNSLGEKGAVMSHTMGYDVLEVSGDSVKTIGQYLENEERGLDDAPSYPILFNDQGIINSLYEDVAVEAEAGLEYYSARQSLPARDRYSILKRAPDGKIVYVADYEKVILLNSATLEIEAENSSVAQSYNVAVAVSPSGEIVSIYEGGAYRLDSETLEEVASSNIEATNWVAVYAGDGYVYANHFDNGLVQIDPSDLSKQQQWTDAADWINSILWGLDGFVWCCVGHYWGGSGDYHIYKINPETFKVEADIEINQELEADNFFEFLKWTQDGYILNAHTTDGVLYLVFIDPESATVSNTVEHSTDYAVTGLAMFYGDAPTNADRFVGKHEWRATTDAEALLNRRWPWRSTTEMQALTNTRWDWRNTTDTEALMNTRWQQRSTTELELMTQTRWQQRATTELSDS